MTNIVLAQTIRYKRQEAPLDYETVRELYLSSTLAQHRPVDDRPRIEAMQRHANLTITAWDGDRLVGLARSITDWVWLTYLADLAVSESHQRQGIGKELMRLTQLAAPQARMLLLAAPAARTYYPHVGFTHMPHAYWLQPGERISE